jgi:hypothetical protein
MSGVLAMAVFQTGSRCGFERRISGLVVFFVCTHTCDLAHVLLVQVLKCSHATEE